MSRPVYDHESRRRDRPEREERRRQRRAKHHARDNAGPFANWDPAHF